MISSIAIGPEEHRARCDAILEHTRGAGLSGVVLFDPYYVLYYAGFAFVPTERPIALVLGGDGTRALVVPRLELEHAEARSTLDRVEHYLEYPGDPPAEQVLAKTLTDLGLTGTIGADQDGYPWILGYRGPTLSELSGASVVRVVETIEAQMSVKSPAGGTTRGTPSACATTKARSSTRATTRRSDRAWCSRSSRASTHRSSAAFATPTPSSSRTTEPRS